MFPRSTIPLFYSGIVTLVFALGLWGCGSSDPEATKSAFDFAKCDGSVAQSGTKVSSWKYVAKPLPGFLQARAVTIKNALFVVGVENGGSTIDVWGSCDGATWSKQAPKNVPDRPWIHFSVATDGSDILVVGGYYTDKNGEFLNKNRFRYSPTENTWTVAAGNEGGTDVYYSALGYAQSKYVFVDGRSGKSWDDIAVSENGGASFNFPKNPAYPSSTNPPSPTDDQYIKHSGMGIRLGSCLASDGTNLFAMGGVDDKKESAADDVYRKDVWKSTNAGVTWTNLTDTLHADMASFGASCAVVGGKIYYAGGHKVVDLIGSKFNGSSNKVFSSPVSDGVNWTEETSSTGTDVLPEVGWFGFTHIGNTIFWIGGLSYDSNNNGSVYPYVFKSVMQ